MLQIGLITFIISIICLITGQRYFQSKNLVDKIVVRSSHNSIATRSGGLSIFATLFLITLYYYVSSNQIFDFSILIPIGILFTIGLYDDIYQVDFKLKFIFQIIAAKIIVDQGFLIESLNGFFGIYEIPYIIGQFISIFVIVLISNAHNFTDGIDGLAITETFKSLIIIIFISNTGIDSGMNFIFIIIMCSLLPLYYFNFKKSKKVFLGDSGSLFLGGLISVGIISIAQGIYINEFIISTPILILICYLYPIIDLVRVVLIRLYKGKSPFIADRNHIHHKLIDKGYSHALSVLIISVSTGLVQISLLLISSTSI